MFNFAFIDTSSNKRSIVFTTSSPFKVTSENIDTTHNNMMDEPRSLPILEHGMIYKQMMYI